MARCQVFASAIYRLTNKFPTAEKFGLVDQLRRAGVSVALNIAEGSDRKSDAEFKRFLRMSIGSCEEVVTALYIALDQKFIKREDFEAVYEDANKLTAKINALIKTL